MSTDKQKPASAIDALTFLRADHERMKDLFREFETLRGNDEEDERKSALVDEICYELTLHTTLEEEIFYPVLRSAIQDDDMMDEADVEHAGARELVSQLEVMYPGHDHFDATVTVLGEEVGHHIEKEEGEMFEAARQAGIDLDELGGQLAARKEELDEDLGSPASSIDAMEPRGSVRWPSRPPN